MLQAGLQRCLQKSWSTKNNQHNHTRSFLYLIQAQAVLCIVISVTSYYQFCGSTPFEIARGSYGQQRNSYCHTRKYRRNRSGNVRRGVRGKYSINTLQLLSCIPYLCFHTVGFAHLELPRYTSLQPLQPLHQVHPEQCRLSVENKV